MEWIGIFLDRHSRLFSISLGSHKESSNFYTSAVQSAYLEQLQVGLITHKAFTGHKIQPALFLCGASWHYFRIVTNENTKTPKALELCEILHHLKMRNFLAGETVVSVKIRNNYFALDSTKKNAKVT